MSAAIVAYGARPDQALLGRRRQARVPAAASTGLNVVKTSEDHAGGERSTERKSLLADRPCRLERAVTIGGRYLGSGRVVSRSWWPVRDTES